MEKWRQCTHWSGSNSLKEIICITSSYIICMNRQQWKGKQEVDDEEEKSIFK